MTHVFLVRRPAAEDGDGGLLARHHHPLAADAEGDLTRDEALSTEDGRGVRVHHPERVREIVGLARLGPAPRERRRRQSAAGAGRARSVAAVERTSEAPSEAGEEGKIRVRGPVDQLLQIPEEDDVRIVTGRQDRVLRGCREDGKANIKRVHIGGPELQQSFVAVPEGRSGGLVQPRRGRIIRRGWSGLGIEAVDAPQHNLLLLCAFRQDQVAVEQDAARRESDRHQVICMNMRDTSQYIANEWPTSQNAGSG